MFYIEKIGISNTIKEIEKIAYFNLYLKVKIRNKSAISELEIFNKI